MKLPICEGNFV